MALDILPATLGQGPQGIDNAIALARAVTASLVSVTERVEKQTGGPRDGSQHPPER